MGYEVHLYVVNSSVDYPFTGTLHCYKIDTLSTLGKAKAYIQLQKSIQRNGFHVIIDHRYRLNKATELFWQKVIYRQQNVLHYIHSARLYNYIFTSKIWNKIGRASCRERVMVSGVAEHPSQNVRRQPRQE